MRIEEGVYLLSLPMVPFDADNFLHPTLLWDGEQALLVDAGLPTQSDLIRTGLEQEGVPWSALRTVLITHHDIDHLGGLAELLAARPELQVAAHAAERPYIQGEIPPIKLTTAKQTEALQGLSEERRRAVTAAMAKMRARVDKTVADGEELPLCGGLVAVHLPGHTPGHLCFYHRRSRILIAGDALNTANGMLLGPNPKYTHDQTLATASLRKLIPLQIEAVICYHGGVYRGGIKQRLLELAG